MAEDMTREYSPLMHAISGGDEEGAVALIRARKPRTDVAFQETVKGLSALMLAAEGGQLRIVEELLLAGAPWNAVDREGRSAGDFALLKGHQEVVDRLVNAGVQAELMFRAMNKDSGLPKQRHSRLVEKVEALRQAEEAAFPADVPSSSSGGGNGTNAGAGEEGEGGEGGKKVADSLGGAGRDPYLDKEVRYEGKNLVDEDERGVMMEWEKPLMVEHARELCETGGDVLNVGFGLGLIDTAIASHAPRSHTIIEAHPTVYAKMLADGWDKKPGVRIVHGRWQDVIFTLGQTFDAVYFDTFSDVSDLDEFHDTLPFILKPGGLYSFFNGVCPDSLFFQGVACALIETSLASLGFTTEFVPIDLDVDESEWAGISNRYFRASVYYLPRVRRPLEDAAAPSSS